MLRIVLQLNHRTCSYCSALQWSDDQTGNITQHFQTSSFCAALAVWTSAGMLTCIRIGYVVRLTLHLCFELPLPAQGCFASKIVGTANVVRVISWPQHSDSSCLYRKHPQVRRFMSLLRILDISPLRRDQPGKPSLHFEPRELGISGEACMESYLAVWESTGPRAAAEASSREAGISYKCTNPPTILLRQLSLRRLRLLRLPTTTILRLVRLTTTAPATTTTTTTNTSVRLPPPPLRLPLSLWLLVLLLYSYCYPYYYYYDDDDDRCYYDDDEDDD